MSDFSRFALRLRRRLVRCYEALLLAALLALAIAALSPAAAAGGEQSAAEAHCGNNHSSATVSVR